MITSKLIKNLSKAIRIISKICRVFLVIGFAFTILSSILLLAIGKDYFVLEVGADPSYKMELNIGIDLREMDIPGGLTDNIEIGENYIKVGLDNINFRVNNYQIGVSLWAYAIETVALYAVFLFVGKLFKTFEDSVQLFTAEAYNNIKNLGISLIVWAIVPPFMAQILTQTMSNTESLINVSSKINLESAIFTLVYIIILNVFKTMSEKNIVDIDSTVSNNDNNL